MIIASPIITPRLSLRPLTTSDAGASYLAWMHDSEILRHLEVRHAPMQTTETLAEFITAANASADTLLLGICLRENGRHIGNIKLGPICRPHRRGDLGFLIGDRTVWGCGYAGEAIHATAAFAVRELDLHKVTANCKIDNFGSIKALEKAGFCRDAILRDHWFVDGEFKDSCEFAYFSGEKSW